METQKSNSASPFSQPEKGDLPVDQMKLPVVEYGTLKMPAMMVKKLTKADIDEGLSTSKLGFSFWDKQEGKRIQIGDFTFVVLEVYSQLSGMREIGPKNFIKYYSNKVKDSRSEPFALFQAGIKAPIEKGLYQDLKGNPKEGKPSKLPDGVDFNLIFVAYWIEGDRLLSIRLTTMVSREIKKAMAVAESSAGRTRKPDDVKLFGLTDTGKLWGFKFETFRRADKDGNDWASGDLYFVPKFYAGVVKDEGPNAAPELYNLCRTYQEQIKAEYAAAKAKRAQYGDEVDSEEHASTDQPGGDERFPDAEPGRTGGFSDDNGTPVPGDDLPF